MSTKMLRHVPRDARDVNLSCAEGNVISGYIYMDDRKRNIMARGEMRLMVAVLEDAICKYKKFAYSTDRQEMRTFAEIDEWVMSKDKERLYSFESICEHLNINADYLRKGLAGWKHKRLNGAGSGMRRRPANA